ncbi:signal peptidase I [Mariniluteicoccus flavus]
MPLSRYGGPGRPEDDATTPGHDPDATTVRPVQRRPAGDEATLPPPGQGGPAVPAPSPFAPRTITGPAATRGGDTVPRPRGDAAGDTVPRAAVPRPTVPPGPPADDEGTVLQPHRRWVSGGDVRPPTNARPDLYRQRGESRVQTPAPVAGPASYAHPRPPEPQPQPRGPVAAPVRSSFTPRTGTTAHSATEVQRTTGPAPARPSRTGPPRRRRRRRAAGEKAEKKPATLLGTAVELVVIVAMALVLSFLLRTFVAQPFEVPSGSMENTLRIGDKIWAEKITAVERGDIVVFRDANHWLQGEAKQKPTALRKFFEVIGLAPDSADEHLVKRVVGMPGDRVKCCDKQGRMSVNGMVLDESAYLYSDAAGMVRASNFDYEVVVPEGHIFVLGDHRNASSDSRCKLGDVSLAGPGGAAFIPLDAVVGTVPAIFLPFDRLRRLENPPIYRAVPPPQQAPPKQPLVVKSPEPC